MEKQIELTVYFDGLCKVCNQEINHYKKQIGSDYIEFIDICSGQFDAVKEGLDPLQIHKVMHARRRDGRVVTRVEAFIEIWKVLHKYRWLAKMESQSFVRWTLNTGYSGFALIRPLLPRYSKAADCQDSPYCDLNMRR